MGAAITNHASPNQETDFQPPLDYYLDFDYMSFDTFNSFQLVL